MKAITFIYNFGCRYVNINIHKNSYGIPRCLKYSSKTTTGAGVPKTEGTKKKEGSVKSSPKKEAAGSGPHVQKINLTYSSTATPKAPSNPVGPGASKTGEYKNAEYFCYNHLSYFDLETEMMNDRLPQPKSGNELF